MNTRLFFNPFEKIAGFTSLAIGLTAMLLAGYVGFLSKTHFDGILNAHSGIQAEWYVHLLGPVFNIAVVSIWFSIFAFIFSKSKIRLIDVTGTQCFAFLPMLPVSVMGSFKVMDDVNQQIQLLVTNPDQPLIISPISFVAFIIIILLTMAFTVWSAIWIYNGYKVAANLPQKVHITVYVTGLIIGMIVPKILLSLL